MSIFDLHFQVLADYRDFVRSFFTIADDRTREFVDQALDEEARLWPDPLLQVSPSYARAATVDELAGSGLILEETARIFRTPEGQPFHLYRHQVEAIELARTPRSYIVTTGTGSGKSLTYFLPIIDALLRQPSHHGGRFRSAAVRPSVHQRPSDRGDAGYLHGRDQSLAPGTDHDPGRTDPHHAGPLSPPPGGIIDARYRLSRDQSSKKTACLTPKNRASSAMCLSPSLRLPARISEIVETASPVVDARLL